MKKFSILETVRNSTTFIHRMNALYAQESRMELGDFDSIWIKIRNEKDITELTAYLDVVNEALGQIDHKVMRKMEPDFRFVEKQIKYNRIRLSEELSALMTYEKNLTPESCLLYKIHRTLIDVKANPEERLAGGFVFSSILEKHSTKYGESEVINRNIEPLINLFNEAVMNAFLGKPYEIGEPAAELMKFIKDQDKAFKSLFPRVKEITEVAVYDKHYRALLELADELEIVSLING